MPQTDPQDDVTADSFYDVKPHSPATDSPEPDSAPSSAGPDPLGTSPDGASEPWIEPNDVPGVRAALLRYRVMAYVVGTLLIVLVCIAMPLKYAAGQPLLVNVVGVAHGWLYAVLLITAYMLGRRAGWPLSRLVLIALAGTVPFLSFVAEYFARKDVHRRIDEAMSYWAAHPQAEG